MSGLNRRDALKKTAAGLAFTGSLGVGAARASDPGAKYLILSCDGGGYRGALAARIIQKLESEVPFLDRVQLFAGTSTGGIIALGLAKGLGIGALVSLYEDDGPRIFAKADAEARSAAASQTLREWLHLDKLDLSVDKLDLSEQFGFSLRDCLRPKYGNDGLKAVLSKEECLGKDKTFADLRPGKSALVTTLRLADEEGAPPGAKKGWQPLVLHNLDLGRPAPDAPVEDGPTMDTRLVDAALSTSAAPLYFPPYKLPGFGYCVDGGLFANCPASVALSAAIRAGHALPSIRILSIGTGTQVNSIPIPSRHPFESAEKYGAFAWLSPVSRNGKQTPAFPLLSALFDASAATHNYLCKQILGREAYHRVQVNLAEPISLDEVSRRARMRIHKAADDLFASQDWKDTRAWLGRRLA